MGRVKDKPGFKTGFQQRSALVQQWQNRFVSWRLWSPRIGFLCHTPLPHARILGPPGGKNPLK